MFFTSLVRGQLEKFDISSVYRISMFVVALLVGLSFFNLFFLINKQKAYAELINISGKQRMHSERVHSVLQLILHDPSDENYQELVLILETMKRDYRSLHGSLSTLGMDEPNIYTHGYDNTVLKALYEPRDLLKRPPDKAAVNNVLMHRKRIIDELNLAVEQLQQKSDYLNEIMIKRGAVLLIVILMVLLIISIVIFHPLLTHLKKENQTVVLLNTELEQRVKERTHRLQTMLDIVNQYVYTTYTDTKGVITYVTDAFCTLSGYSRDELLGKTHSVIKHPDTPDSVFASLWQTLLKGEAYQGIIQNRHKSGEGYWLNSYVVPEKNDEGDITGFWAFRRNISDQVRLEELNNELENRVVERTKEIERIAVTDALTGLFNRHRFNVEIEDALALYKRYQTPITLAILDIDYFKRINDTFGHNIGDETLVSLAALLQKHIRQTDKLARWGGEEFVILFINTELNEALMAAESLLEIIRTFLFKSVGTVTCSIGLAALMPTDVQESFLQRADASLYRAKEQGRNRVCYQYIG